MEIKNNYITRNRPYTKRSKTTAIAVHWVANPGSTAIATRNYFQNTDRSVSSNFVVGLKGEVICCIPDNEVSWCTNNANSYTISIETCHPDWTGKFSDITYNSLVALCSMLCNKYGLNPLNGGIIRHFDVTGKDCPKCFVMAKNGGTDDNSNTAWNKFKNDVAKEIGHATSTPTANKDYLFKVKVIDSELNIRKDAGVNNAKVGTITDNGVYRIIETKQVGNCQWGRLHSKAGWINVDKKYCNRIE